jgi:hypothetical protein
MPFVMPWRSVLKHKCKRNVYISKCLYLEAHASNALSSALNVEIKDGIEVEYGLLERADLLWKVLDQMFGSSNKNRSSSNVPENNSSSSIHIDQDQEDQSSVQKEEVISASLGKPDGPVLAEQKLSWLKRKIVPRQVPTPTMTPMMSMMIKSSCWSFKNS